MTATPTDEPAAVASPGLTGSASKPHSAGALQVAARLERLPFTGYQRLLFLIIATAWLFDSIDLASLTFVLGPISDEFGLTASQAGIAGSMGFAGMLIGAIVAGALADRFGRRVVFQYSIVIWGLASLGLFFSWDLTSLLLFRFALGFGMGAEFPVAASLLAEFMPADRRGRYVALLEGAWPIGFVLAGVMALLLVPGLGWRALFGVQAALAVWALVIRRAVPESPRWLASRGRHDDAERVMTQIEDRVARSSGLELPAPAAVVSDPLAKHTSGLRDLFSAAYRRRTLAAWAVWFCILLGYYGLTTWLGKLLVDNGFDVAKSIEFVLLMTLWGIPGFASAAYLVEKIGRKVCLASYTVGSAVAAYFYGQVDSDSELIMAGSLLQFFLFGMWSSLYALTPELFPTRSRGLGVGTATAAGRLGALLGPVLVPVLMVAGGTGVVFAAGAALFAGAAMIVLIFVPETKQALLEEVSR